MAEGEVWSEDRLVTAPAAGAHGIAPAEGLKAEDMRSLYAV